MNLTDIVFAWMPQIVQFLQYRRHDLASTEANNAIMALLAGAHLAAHSLQLNEGSDQLLPAIYPRVPHIQRFNLLASHARLLLNDAESHLGAMSVPYVLATHEDFVTTTLDLVGDNRSGRNASNMHARLSETIGVDYGSALGAFQAARLLRNCIIHAGGVWDSERVEQAERYVDDDADHEWTRHTSRSVLKIRPGVTVTIGNGELIATLSATKGLAKQINYALQPALSRNRWADLLIADLEASEPAHLSGADRLKKCRGFARHLYTPLGLADSEIADALGRAGH